MNRKIIALIALSLGMMGCAQGARIDQMTAMPTVPLPANSVFQRALQVNNVSGGTSTNPLWVSKVGNPEFQAALQSSLGSAGLLASGSGRFRLDAQLRALEQPMIGFDMNVVSTVHYAVTDINTSKQVFDNNIVANYTATMSDAFMAVERLRLANEGAIKRNIQMFMDQLIASGQNPVVGRLFMAPAPGGYAAE